MQNVSLGEYGSGWEWKNDWQETMHAFDQASSDGVPVTYTDNGASLGYCFGSIEDTQGELLNSNSVMKNQVSCRANVGNAGNFYTWPASTAGGIKLSGLESNSVCPKGWQLTTNTADGVKSFDHLIRTVYNIQEAADTNIRPLPLSFIRSGYYYLGSLSNRGLSGLYWSAVAYVSTNAYNLVFYSGNLLTRDNYSKYRGFPVRCVSR